MEYWYRADDCSYSVSNEYGDHSHSIQRINIRRFKVIRHTPKGVWIDEYGEERFVLGRARKQYAVPTVEIALHDLRARKIRQESIYLARAKNARRIIDSIDGSSFSMVGIVKQWREE